MNKAKNSKRHNPRRNRHSKPSSQSQAQPKFFFPSSCCPAQRIYISEDDGTLPTVRDLEHSLRDLRIPEVVKVLGTFHHGDVWMQDQFKELFYRSAAGLKRGVLHFPRVHLKEPAKSKVNILRGKQHFRGLADLVERHFREARVEVLDDLRQRSLKILEAHGREQLLQFEEGADLYNSLWRVFDLHRLTSKYLPESEIRGRRNAGRHFDFTEAYRALPRLTECAVRRLYKQLSSEKSKRARHMALRRVRDFANRLDEILSDIRLTKQRLTDSFSVRWGNKRLTVTKATASALYKQLEAFFSSENRGGNIEVAPPSPNESHGNLIVGATAGVRPGKLGKSEIFEFLRKRCAQPLLEVDTSWLRVGHVDELLSVVPYQGTEADFAILCASSGAAILILEEAAKLYRCGLPTEHPHRAGYEFSGRDRRRTTEGRFPITFLFRGRNWVHQHERNAMKPLEPPQIYQAMAIENARCSRAERLPFSPGAGARALYPSGMSIPEALHFEDRTNADIERLFLTPMIGRLRAKFPKARMLPLPVLFDRLSAANSFAGRRDVSYMRSRQDFHRQCIALTPNLVNLQVLGKRLILPRPHGPRMRPNDAVTVIRRVMATMNLDVPVRSDVSMGNQADTVHWAVANRRHVNGIAREFCDGFPGANIREIAERILRANHRHFDARGYLQRGWRRLIIPEGTVDLFELFTQSAAASLGLQARFVEVWYYHARHGGIHCATNVMRRMKSNAEC